MRRKTGVLLGALTVAAVAVAGIQAAQAANAAVSIQNFSFQPQDVTINVGESVTWTMKDMGTQHTVTANDNSFSSSNLSTNNTYAHTFGQAGTFSYHCNIHPSMTGTVTVVGSAPPATQPPAPAPAPAPSPQPAPAAAPAPTTPRTTTPPATTVAPTTTTTSPTTTTIAPPAAAETGTTSSTLAAAGGGVALPAQKTSTDGSSGDGGVSPWLIALGVVLVAGTAAGTFYLRRRAAA